MKRIIAIASILVVVTVCQTVAAQSSTGTATRTSLGFETKRSKNLIYSPEGKEEFVFNEIEKTFQSFGYDNFCKDTKTFHTKLSYSKYVGTRGYFDSEKPIHTYMGYDYYPVVLQNGEKYYYITKEEHGGKYGLMSQIIPYEQYKELKNFSREPIVEGLDIFLVDARISYGSKYYSLSNSLDISEKKLNLIREITSKYKKNSAEIAKLLLDLKIDKDEVDYRYFISPDGDMLRSEAKLYIGFNDKDTWLRFKVKYCGDDWLFVKSFKIAADDYRWQSAHYEFKRDHSSGNVWEWIDIPANEKEIELARKLADANNALIRFQGSQYYSDKALQYDQKKGIANILKLYELMKN